MNNSKRVVDKPWGNEEIWAETSAYVGKVLNIAAGHSLSRQYHVLKEETFRVLTGDMDLEIGDPAAGSVTTLHMSPGDVFHCPPGTIHRMIAKTQTAVLEVSTPHLEDVVRLEDAYGRKTTC